MAGLIENIKNISNLSTEKVADIRSACESLSHIMKSDGYSVGNKEHQEICAKASETLVSIGQEPIKDIDNFRPSPTKTNIQQNPDETVVSK